MRAPSAGPASPLLLGAHWYEDDPGGLHRYLADLFSALQRAGAHPRAVVAGPATGAPVGVAASGHLSRPFPLRLASYAAAVRRAAATGPAVVDAHFAFYALWPVTVGSLRRLPLVVHFQGPWADESAAAGERARWRLRAKRAIEAAVYRKAGHFVVLSEAFRDLLVGRYGVAPWKVTVLAPGIDLERFHPADRSQARQELGLEGAGPLVVAVRRLVPRMGLDVLVEAWAHVSRTLPVARLVIVGDGPERAALEVAAAASCPPGSVRFLGRVPEADIARCYQAADLSVVPTVALEGFGLVVLESLACGTAPVVTDAGGLAEAVVPLDPSLVVPASDPVALGARVLAALDGTRPAPDGGRCRAHAERFGWGDVARRHQEIYAGLHRPGPRRLRVVYLDHCARLSGGELAMLHLLPALDVDAHVILAEDGPLVEALRRVGLSVEVLPMDREVAALGRERVRPGALPVRAVLSSGAYAARLARRLRRLRPDIVHTNSLKSALYGGMAARMAAIPVVWHVRDRIAEDYLPPAAVWAVRVAARLLPSAVITNSRATLATLGRAGAGGTVVPSPLGFEPVAEAVVRLDAGQPLRFGMVGRLDRWKGQHLFIAAFARAFPAGDERAVIVGAPIFGDGGYAHELEALVAGLGLGDRVEMRGFRDDIRAELARLDVLVHASTIPEPFGQVVVEGMAAGLPVVAARAGGPAEVIDDGVDGLLYPPGNVEALARILVDLSADPDRRRKLGEAARNRSHDFVPERIAPMVGDVYRAVKAQP